MAEQILIEQLRKAGINKPEQVADAVTSIAPHMTEAGWRKLNQDKFFSEPHYNGTNVRNETRAERVERFVTGIEQVVKTYGKYGLTLENYVQKAVLKHTRLARRSPESIEDKVEKFVAAFSDDGFTAKEFVMDIAMKQPTLLSRSSDEIIGTAKYLQGCAESGLIDTTGRSGEQSFTSWIAKYPAVLTLSSDNIEMKMAWAKLREKPIKGKEIRDSSKSLVAKQLIALIDSAEEINTPSTVVGDAVYKGKAVIEKMLSEGTLKAIDISSEGKGLSPWVQRAQELKANTKDEKER